MNIYNSLFDYIYSFVVKKLEFLILVLVLLVYSINAYFNYSAVIVDDTYVYFQSAKMFLNSSFIYKYPIYDMLRDHSLNLDLSSIDTNKIYAFIENPQNQLVSIVSIGMSILIAPFYWLFGIKSWWILIIFRDVLFLFTFYNLTSTFLKSKNSLFAYKYGLLSVVLYATTVNFTLTLYRDIFCATILCISTLLIHKASIKKKLSYWHLSFALICLMIIIKIIYLFLVIPFFIYFYKSEGYKLITKQNKIKNIFFFFIIILIFLLPFFIQNKVATGSVFLPAQFKTAKSFIPGSNKDYIEYLFLNFKNMIVGQLHIFSINGLPIWTGFVVFLLSIFGLIKGYKYSLVRYWILPNISFFYIFLVLRKHNELNQNLYLTPTNFLIIFLAILGIIYIMDIYIKNRSFFINALIFVFLIPFLVIKIDRSFVPHRHIRFQLKEANLLCKDLENIIAPGSLLLCNLPLAKSIDFYSNFYSFPLWYLEGKNNTALDKINTLMNKNISVYFSVLSNDLNNYSIKYIRSKFDVVNITMNQSLYKFPIDNINNLSCNAKLQIYIIKKK